MKKLFGFAVLSLFLATAVNAYAEQAAAPVAMPGAGEETVLDQMGDWFATIGKTTEDKQVIITQRKADRAAQRAQMLIEKKVPEIPVDRILM